MSMTDQEVAALADELVEIAVRTADDLFNCGYSRQRFGEFAEGVGSDADVMRATRILDRGLLDTQRKLMSASTVPWSAITVEQIFINYRAEVMRTLDNYWEEYHRAAK